MGGKAASGIAGFRYLMDVHFICGRGPFNRLTKIFVGDRVAWGQPIEASATVTIDQADLFGGDDREGGIVGELQVMFGEDTQTLSGAIAEAYAPLTTAFRKRFGAFFRGQIATNNPYPKPWAFEAERTTAGWYNNDPWHPELGRILLTCEAGPSPPTPEFNFVFTFPTASVMLAAPIEGSTVTFLDLKNQFIQQSFDQLIALKTELDAGVKLNVGWGIWDTNIAVSVQYDLSVASLEAMRDLLLSFGGLGYYFMSAMGVAIATAVDRLDNNGNTGPRYFYNLTAGPDLPTAIDGLFSLGTPATRVQSLRDNTETARQSSAVLRRILLHGVDDALGPVTVHNDPASAPRAFQDGDSFPVEQIVAAVSGIDAAGGPLYGANGAHMIYEATTNPTWGEGWPTGLIDEDSFLSAAQTLFEECFPLCIFWNRQQSVGDFVQQVCDHIGGVRSVNRRTGAFQLKLIRDDYDPETLPLFDEEDIIEIEWQRAGYGELVNRITVIYRDVETDKDMPVTVSNQACIRAQQGSTISEVRQYPMCPTFALAQRIALRDLRAASSPIAKGKLTLKRSAWNVVPGDVIKFSWPKLGLTEIIGRVLGVDYGEILDGRIIIDLAEDVFGFGLNTYQGQQPIGWQPPDTSPKVALRITGVEAPYYALVKEIGDDDAAALDADAGFVGVFAVDQGATSLGIDIYTRVGSAELQKTGAGRFSPGGVLREALPANSALIKLEQLQGFTAIVRVGDVVVIGAVGREAEWAQITAISGGGTDLTVTRAILDTTPVAWPLGTRVWINIDGRGAASTTEYATGQAVTVAVLTRATGGVTALGSAPRVTVTPDQRQARPYPPGNVQINGLPWPTSLTGTLTITWSHRDRLLQSDVIVAQTEPDIGPEAGVTYNVYAYDDATDTLLDSDTGLTDPTWTPSLSGTYVLRIEIESARDGLVSWQRQIRTFAYAGTTTETGFGLITEQGVLIRFE